MQLVPLPPGADPADTAVHDQQTAELARYKLGLHTARTPTATAATHAPPPPGKIRCPLRPQSMALGRDRPEILTPPPHPPVCCIQQTITAGPQIAEKTRQKYDYPSAAWRASYRRRTAAERLNATIKDTATTSIGRGWIRLTGVTSLMLSLACLTVVRNQRILNAFGNRQHHHARRPAGQPPQTRAAAATSRAAPAPPSAGPGNPSATAAAVLTPASQPKQQLRRPFRPPSATPRPRTAPRHGPSPRKPQRPPNCQTQM